MTHELKCGDEYIEQMWNLEKKAEFRLLDREYQIGDILALRGNKFMLETTVTCVTELKREQIKKWWSIDPGIDFVMLSIIPTSLERISE